MIKDWQRFKQLEAEQRELQEEERLKLMKKLSMTCNSHLDDELQKKKQKDEEEQIENLLMSSDDPFLKEYMQRRMEEMIKQFNQQQNQSPKFGELIHLKSGGEFLEAIEQEDKSVTIICHIFNHKISGCDSMKLSLDHLAKRFHNYKFCSIEASSAGMSRHFVSLNFNFVN